MRSQLKVVSGILACLFFSIVTGCGSSGTSVSITQSGSSTTISAGSGAVTLTAAVSHATNTDVTWTFSGAGCGTFTVAGNTATYTPPAESALTSDCTVTITATSTAKTSATKKIVFTVRAVTLTLPGGESLSQTVSAGGGGITLTVDITNDESGDGVTWTLKGAQAAVAHAVNRGAGLQPAIVPTTCGSLSANSGTSVKFTPPAVGPCTATITASATANPNVTQTFTVTVSAQALTVSITQSGSSTTVLSGSAAVTLTATVTGATNTSVTWNFSGSGCGTFTSSGNTATYTPPAEASLNANCTATITATSVASTSVTSQIVFTVDAVALTLPSGESLTQTVTAGGAPITLTADITDDASGEGVTWALTGEQTLAHRANAAAWSTVDQALRKSFLFGKAGLQPAILSSVCGSLSAASGTSVTFTPPATGSCTATVTASATADPSVTKTFTITVNAATVPTYTISGAVTGLSSGTSVVLLLNGADPATVSSNTSFEFSTALASGTSYQVTVGTEPTGESCQVANGGPAAITADVTNVAVTCSPAASVPSVVAEHELAQTGLAIALASNVLQSQLAVLQYAQYPSIACTQSSDKTYYYATDATPTTIIASTPPTSLYLLTLYYDASCADKYIVADVTSTNASTQSFQETATYYGLTGTELGTLTLSVTLTATGSSGSESYSANGLGTFCPGTSTCASSTSSSLPQPVQLGLYCTLAQGATSWPCGGGIVQNFPALNLAIGAVTPLTLIPATGSTTALTFSGGGTAYSGPIGSLTLTDTSVPSLGITGGTVYTPTITVSGSAASFSLFPPTPTSWTIKDTNHNEEIVFTVESGTLATRITITDLMGNPLGTGAGATVDQSGTSTGSGNMTYSDGSTAAITSWTLAD